MIFVADHDSCRIQSQVATQRETWVIHIRGQFENQSCFEALAGRNLRIEARVGGGTNLGLGQRALS